MLMNKKTHTTTEKTLAAALYAFLADFPDYTGPTHRAARAALRRAGFPIWDPPEVEPTPETPLVLIECDGGVARWRGARGEVECFVLDWDVLDMGAGHDDPPAAFRAVAEWGETFAEFDRKRAGEEGTEDE
jgi:hypothetical protein